MKFLMKDVSRLLALTLPSSPVSMSRALWKYQEVLRLVCRPLSTRIQYFGPVLLFPIPFIYLLMCRLSLVVTRPERRFHVVGGYPSPHSLDRLPVCRRANTERPFMLTLSPMGNLEFPFMYLDCGRKQEHQDRTHPYTSRTCKLTQWGSSTPITPPCCPNSIQLSSAAFT